MSSTDVTHITNITNVTSRTSGASAQKQKEKPKFDAPKLKSPLDAFMSRDEELQRDSDLLSGRL